VVETVALEEPAVGGEPPHRRLPIRIAAREPPEHLVEADPGEIARLAAGNLGAVDIVVARYQEHVVERNLRLERLAGRGEKLGREVELLIERLDGRSLGSPERRVAGEEQQIRPQALPGQPFQVRDQRLRHPPRVPLRAAGVQVREVQPGECGHGAPADPGPAVGGFAGSLSGQAGAEEPAVRCQPGGRGEAPGQALTLPGP
jgi:hypothetical protein